MNEFIDAEEVKSLFEEQREKQIQDLNQIIIAFRTRVALLEKEIEERNKLPVPKTVLYQVLELENKIKKLEEDIAYYKRYVPTQVIINRENKSLPTRKGGLR
jgi:hypothetical protein